MKPYRYASELSPLKSNVNSFRLKFFIEMSSCIKDLKDYDLNKKCSKCGIISLKSNFH